MRVIHEKLVHQRNVAFLRRLAGHILAIHQDLATADAIQSRHQFDQGCFASTRFPQQHIEMPRLKAQRRFFDVGNGTDAFGDVL